MIIPIILFGLILFMAFYLWSRGPAKGMPRRRVVIYALITVIIESLLIWANFSPIWHELNGAWLYLSLYNVGLLLLVWGYKSSPGLIGFLLPLSLGIICMFLFTSTIGETISWLGRKREKHE